MTEFLSFAPALFASLMIGGSMFLKSRPCGPTPRKGELSKVAS